MAVIPGTGGMVSVNKNGSLVKKSVQTASPTYVPTKNTPTAPKVTVVPGTAGKVTITNGSLSAPKQGNITPSATGTKSSNSGQYSPTAGFSGKGSGVTTKAPSNNTIYNGSGATSTYPYESAASNDDYYQKLLDAKRAGILSEFEANTSIIKNNLSKALSDLAAEKAALAPVYQNQLSAIAYNQFNTQEQMKELMNQGGWNTGNSGVAVGEQGKIRIGADSARGEALGTYSAGIADANRRITTTNQVAADEMASLEKQKNAMLKGADAEAWTMNQDRIAAAAQAAQDYQLKLQSAADKQASSYRSTTDKATAQATKDRSAQTKRDYTSYVNRFFNEGNLQELIDLQSGIAADSNLLDADFIYLDKILADRIAELKKTSASTPTTTTTAGGTPSGSIYPRNAGYYKLTT